MSKLLPSAPVGVELSALRVQEWLQREYDILPPVQEIEQAMRTPCSCPDTERALAQQPAAVDGAMTSNVELLLPLSDWMECLGEISADEIRDYARANVAHATAPLQAEIEALRAEVAEARDGWHMANGTADLAMKHRDAAEARAERLAQALVAERDRWAARKADAIREQAGGMTRGDPGAVARCDAAIQRIDAALHPTAAQEGKESFWPKLPGSGGPDWTGHD